MEDFIFAPLVLAVGFGIHQAVLRNHQPWEARLLNIAFAAHVVSGVVQVLLVRYYFPGGGDMLTYFENGAELADVLRSDFTRFAPELAKAFLQSDEVELPVALFGASSTMSMSATSSFLLFLTGNSLYAAVTLIAIASYLSQVLLYRALKAEFAPERHRAVLIGTNLLPSAVFWSCALLKEPIVMATLGPSVLGLKWLSEGRRRWMAVLLLAPSIAVVVAIKPYVLMGLSVASGVFYLWKRLRSAGSSAMKPFAIVSAIALGSGGLVLGNKFFAKGESDSAAAALAQQRANGYAVEGGSNFQLEGTTELRAIEQRSLAQETLLAPLALLTALFRPFIFEARNAVQFANGLEATALLFLFLRAIRRTSWKQMLAQITSSPALMFCVVFTLALALGTGLSSTNMGTLSRYRAPMMPFFFTVLLILDQVSREQTRSSPLSPAVAAR